MTVKRSVALVIPEAGGAAGPGRSGPSTDPDAPRGRVLLVLRPPDDEDLPDVWGLPAASLAPGESWEDAVRRAAREKLGVEVEPAAVLNEGSKARPTYTLEMRLYEARLVAGEPDVEQPGEEAAAATTRYAAWKWADAIELRPAAARGSLCSKLFLEAKA